MTKRIARIGAAGVGALLLTGVAGTAFAADPVGDGSDVNLMLTVDCDGTPLSMEVDDADVRLAEVAAASGQRQFEGTIGDVTIRDGRCAEDIDPDVFWWVQGSATDFAGQSGQSDIESKHLGWAPALVDGGDAGLVSEGDPVNPNLDGGDGFDPGGPNGGEEFLVQVATTSGDPDLVGEDEWIANANMVLKVPDAVESGRYVSVLTLTLFA
jgi:hypothetical protein